MVDFKFGGRSQKLVDGRFGIVAHIPRPVGKKPEGKLSMMVSKTTQ
jgi:hypothetical protein